jgi:methyl-accepting chemotaxis protein
MDNKRPSISELQSYVAALNRAQAVIEFEMDGTITHANKNFLDCFGFSLEELVGKHHRVLCDPGYVKTPAYRQLWEKLNSGNFERGEFKRFTKDGHEVWIQASYNPILDEAGKPIRVVKFATDITAEKNRNIDFEGKITAINKHQAVIEFTTDGIIVAANDNFCQAVGYTRNEIIGKHHRIFCDEKVARSVGYKQFWQHLGAGEVQSGEFQRLRKDGSDLWLMASYNPIFDPEGKVIRIVKFATDITEQKTRNAEFTAKLAALDRVQAVIEFELDGTILTANETFCKVIGYSLEELRGKHHRILCEADYAKSSEYKEFWAKLGRGDVHSGEYKRLGKGGREIWINASYNPILDAAGRPVRVVKFATDITIEKQHRADMQSKMQAIDHFQAVIEFQLDGTVVNANKNFLNATGYTLEEIRGRHHRMFCNEETKQSTAYKDFWEKLALGQVQAGEYRRVRKDGTDVWLQASYNPIFDVNNRPVKVVKFATDITANKLRNAEFEAKNEGISRAQAVIEFSLNGEILHANANFCKAMGYSLDEMRGKHHRIFCTPEYVATTEYKEFWERLRRGEFEGGRFRRITSGGKQVWLQASYIPILDTNGKVYKVVKFASDITTQVNTEIELNLTVQRLASEFTSSSREISERALTVATGTQSLGASTEEMSASVEELSQAILSIAKNTKDADALARGTQAEGEVGTKLITKSIEAMELINRSSEEISEIIKVISEIASQTNLLAFNAAIEAARAGEHGLGFSVVADEVRKLAERSSQATKEISKLITESTKRVTQGSQVSKEAGEAFSKIVFGVAKTTQAISEISVSAQEQQAAAKEVGVAISHIAEETEKSAASSEVIAKATKRLQQGAEELNKNVARASIH